MSDFMQIDVQNGGRVLFQTAESALVQNHGGVPDVEDAEAAMDRLRDIAIAANEVCEAFREKIGPDELTLEIGIGLSGEVGWFFTKSAIDASMKVQITWKSQSSD